MPCWFTRSHGGYGSNERCHVQVIAIVRCFEGRNLGRPRPSGPWLCPWELLRPIKFRLDAAEASALAAKQRAVEVFEGPEA
jgi:hypothetical protein